jgi:hypothetical protein
MRPTISADLDRSQVSDPTSYTIARLANRPARSICGASALPTVDGGNGVQAVALGLGLAIGAAVADLAPVAAGRQDGVGPLLVDAKVDPTIVADWLPDAFRGG